MRFSFVTLWLALVGCGSTIQVGDRGDGGFSPTDGGGSEGGLEPAAAASPYLEKCSLVCAAPADGPCAKQDTAACINKCTAATSGLPVACAQCLVENSGYAGAKCRALGTLGDPIEFGPGGHFEGNSCASSQNTCATCSARCPCTADRERCDGFTMGKTTSCQDSCSGVTSACSGYANGSSAGTGGCTSSAAWRCGADSYSVECACPTKQCKCQKNGSTISVVDYPYSCSDPSNCDRTLVAVGKCGFPLP